MGRYFFGSIMLRAIVLIGCGLLGYGECSRILCVCPTVSISHQVVFRGLALALRERGHEIVIVTPNPLRDPNFKNYTEIDIGFLYDYKMDLNVIKYRGIIPWPEIFWGFVPILHQEIEDIFNYQEFKRIYALDSGEKFDLIILEQLWWQAFLPLAKRFDAPLITLATLGMNVNTLYSTGNPIFSSHASNWELEAQVFGTLTFWQRIMNFVTVWKYIFLYRTEFVGTQEAIARKYFGDDTIDLLEMEKNVSLIFINQQEPISFVRPNLPNVIPIGGFHVAKKINPLPQDLKKTLDNATQGFVYMSLGSNIQSNMLTAEARREFIAAFSKLPYTVLWKFEDDSLPNKPDNVVIMKWTPQQAVLAHPNLKVFVYQGGLQSTEEAISHGVPVIGYPVMADQEHNVNKMVSVGVGKKLEITKVNGDDLLQAIQTIALDGSWKRRMLDLRALLKDKPQDTLEKAIWWTEHVIRHRGVPYLRSSLVDEPWYRRQDIDVLFAIFAGILTALALSLAAVYYSLISSGLISYMFNKLFVRQKKKLQ